MTLVSMVNDIQPFEGPYSIMVPLVVMTVVLSITTTTPPHPLHESRRGEERYLCGPRSATSSHVSTVFLEQAPSLSCSTYCSFFPRLNMWSSVTCQLCRRFCIAICKPKGSSSQTVQRKIKRYVAEDVATQGAVMYLLGAVTLDTPGKHPC